MRLCARAVGWSWQGDTGTFMPGLGVLLLLSLVQPASLDAACPPPEGLQNLTQPQYQNLTGGDVPFATAFIQSFLNTIQPNSLPIDLILKLSQVSDQQKIQEYTKEALIYQRGFLVCAGIGILYMTFMPIIGLFLACCRCCGNCGGKMYQKQTSSVHCRRRTLYWSLFITTIIIFIGNIIMFQGNQALKENINQGLPSVTETVNNIRTFLNAVPQQFNNVVNQSNTTIQEVEGNLDDIGPQLGTEIQKRLEETLNSALSSVKLLNNDTTEAEKQMKSLVEPMSQLQRLLNVLQTNIAAVSDRTKNILTSPGCNSCAALLPELDKLRLNTNISSPALQKFQGALDEVMKSNLTNKIKEVEDYFKRIPQTVTNDTRDVVQDTKKLLGNLTKEISQFTDDLPLSVLNDMARSLDQVYEEISRVMPQVKNVDRIRWMSFLFVAFVVLLVVLCNFLGLLLGPLGLRPKLDPTNRSCTADCGGTFFMMGAGFSFLFSWLFMLIVLVLFLLGGNVYTLACQTWKSGELLQLIDTPGLIPGLDLGGSLGLKDNLTISEVYTGCKEDKPLWTTLRLYEVVNLEELLNVTKYSEEIEKNFNNTNITLSSITLLSPDDRIRLHTFISTTENVNFTEVTQQMSDLSSINLNTTADKLDELAKSQPPDIQDQLNNETTELRKIQSEKETTIDPLLESVNSTVTSLQSTAARMNKNTEEVLSNMAAAQDALNTNTSLIIKTESRRFVDCQMSYFTQYADWANLTITQDVGRCEPVARTVDSAVDILCSQLVDSLNAFWFGLGWCLIFFIPSIILSMKLAKYYRKMKYTDHYDNVMYLHHLPRAQPPLK